MKKDEGCFTIQLELADLHWKAVKLFSTRGNKANEVAKALSYYYAAIERGYVVERLNKQEQGEGEKKRYKIRFKLTDPLQRQAVKILNASGRNMGDVVVNAFNCYYGDSSDDNENVGLVSKMLNVIKPKRKKVETGGGKVEIPPTPSPQLLNDDYRGDVVGIEPPNPPTVTTVATIVKEVYEVSASQVYPENVQNMGETKQAPTQHPTQPQSFPNAIPSITHPPAQSVPQKEVDVAGGGVVGDESKEVANAEVTVAYEPNDVGNNYNTTSSDDNDIDDLLDMDVSFLDSFR